MPEFELIFFRNGILTPFKFLSKPESLFLGLTSESQN